MNNNYDIGMIGLGVMGRNLVLNMADHGFSVAGHDKDPEKIAALEKEVDETRLRAEGQKVRGTKSIEEFIKLLRPPRALVMLVPAGPIVDSVISEVLPHLKPDDLIIDGGNSHYTDTDRRSKELKEKGIQFLGVGISGGERGARFGPSIMPGGPRGVYERLRPLFEAIAAKVNGEPCVAYLGPGSAGHYVKMVHNGIEYGLMQLISETYDLLKRGLGLSNDEFHDIYNEWNQEELQSFLMEITAHIFRQQDEKTGLRLIDVILDKARQKGTGKWTSQDAMDLQVPVPNIDMAVMMRDMSSFKKEREAAAKILSGPTPEYVGDKQTFIYQLRNALYFAMITTYSQGMALLKTASETYGYGIYLREVARIWQGGCIIRARLLEDIRSAFESKSDLSNLMADTYLSKEILKRQGDLRQMVSTAAKWGIPAPGFMASLAYFDGYRSGRLPANLIQAQRDYFGAHTYERMNEEGFFHTQWNKEEEMKYRQD